MRFSTILEEGRTKVENCEFPDDLLYDPEGLVWIHLADSGEAAMGITALYAAVIGRPTTVIAKPLGSKYAKGAAIGFVESARYFGPIRSPVGGTLTAINESVVANPRAMTDSLYADGWFARVRPANFATDRSGLLSLPAGRGAIAKQIAALRVRCFSAFPDYEMFEIGTECAAVLVRLNELLARSQVGEVVHLITDDPTAPIEMVRWSDETHQPIIEERREGNLFHYLLRKVS